MDFPSWINRELAEKVSRRCLQDELPQEEFMKQFNALSKNMSTSLEPKDFMSWQIAMLEDFVHSGKLPSIK